MTTRTGWVQTRSGDWERYNVDTTTGIGTATGYTTTLAGTVNWPYGLGGGASAAESADKARPKTRAQTKASALSAPPRAPFHGPTQQEVAARAAWQASVNERLWTETETLQRERFQAEFGTVADLSRSGNFLRNLSRFLTVKDSVREAETIVQAFSRREIREAISAVTGHSFPAFRTDAAARKHLIEGLAEIRGRLTAARDAFDSAGDAHPVQSAHAVLFAPENPAFSVFAQAVAGKKDQPKMSSNLQELLGMA